MANEVTLAQVETTCRKLHTSLARGYVSRKGGACKITKYAGRFGAGYAVYTANTTSSRYCYVTYYVQAV